MVIMVTWLHGYMVNMVSVMGNMVNSYCSWDIEGRNIRKTAENYRENP